LLLIGGRRRWLASRRASAASRRTRWNGGSPRSHSTHDRDDLVSIAGHGAHRNGPKALIASQVIMRHRDFGRRLKRGALDPKPRGEAMQFIRIIRQQVTPFHALPMPDRVIYIYSHRSYCWLRSTPSSRGGQIGSWRSHKGAGQQGGHPRGCPSSSPWVKQLTKRRGGLGDHSGQINLIPIIAKHEETNCKGETAAWAAPRYRSASGGRAGTHLSGV